MRGEPVEAWVQGAREKNPEGAENSGEHRAPGGLTRHRVATDSQMEQSLEGGPAEGETG
jgi:hypothetical protein